MCVSVRVCVFVCVCARVHTCESVCEWCVRVNVCFEFVCAHVRIYFECTCVSVCGVIMHDYRLLEQTLK